MVRAGIDLGGTNIAAGLVEDGKILIKGSVPTGMPRSYREIVRDMAGLTKRLLEQAGISAQSLECIGIGSPGSVDPENGVVRFAGNLDFHSTPLREELGKYFSCPIFVDNDANCAAVGELAGGAAKGYRDAVMVTFGTGVGGGIVLGGRLFGGQGNAGGEIGHMALHTGGEQCTCGRRGCWEAYASVTALIRQAANAAKEHPDSMLAQMMEDGVPLNGKNIFEAAQTGDETAKKVVEQYVFYMAEGITDLVNLLRPEAVIVGGGICREGERILAPIRRIMERDMFCKHTAPPAVLQATLAGDAGILGAALLSDYQRNTDKIS